MYAEKNGNLGIIKTIAVISSSQRHGIGDRLFVEIETYLHTTLNCSMIAVPAWKDITGIHLDGILISNGYEPFISCEKYWETDCDGGIFKCKGRIADNQCCCDLVWYKRQLE
jgi:hypothetical protein